MYQILYYGGIGLAVLLFLVTILLFIKFDILGIIGNLTGFSEKKGMKSTSSLKSSSGNLKKKKHMENNKNTVLLEEGSQTMPLGENSSTFHKNNFVIVEEITFVHSEEMIL